jgi:hypothetical protein
MWDDEFIKAIFEIAFGENAFERGYSQEEVLTRLRQFSDTALKLENIIALHEVQAPLEVIDAAVERAKEQAS